jgi:hypothetical protein
MIACLVKLLVVPDLEVVFIIDSTDPMLSFNAKYFSQNPHKQIGESRIELLDSVILQGETVFHSYRKCPRYIQSGLVKTIVYSCTN